MRKITKSLLALALLFGAVGGADSLKARTVIDMSTAAASTNATWTAATNTFAWTAENEYIVIPGLSGDLTGCNLDFTIGAACHIDIVDTDDHVKIGDWNGYGRFGSGGSKTQDLEFMVSGSSCDITKVKEVRICSQSASGNLTVTSVSYYFPLKLEYNANGVATVPLKSITATGGISFNPSTGVVTCDGTHGTLSVDFPTSGIDLTALKSFNVTISGTDNIFNNNRMACGGTQVLAYYTSRWGGNLTAAEQTAATAVTSFEWNAKETATLTALTEEQRTFTITSITFTSEMVSCAKAGETVLKSLQYYNFSDNTTATATWNVGTTTDTYYGSGNSGASNYVDLTEYSELRIYRDNETAFRAFFINTAGNGTKNYGNGDESDSSPLSWNSEDKYYSIDLSKVEKYNEKIYLNTIKSSAWGQNNIVNNIVVYKAPVVGSAQYLITGKGLQDAATTALLADATVTSIDATGMTNVTATTLTSANPNCLFKANAGKLSNANNVIVSDACATLALTDGYPFKAPAAFTATAAPTYDRAFTASTTTTVCLPFALTTAEAATLGTFYELSSIDGTTLHFTSVDAPEANKAYLVVPTATSLTPSETGKSIAATPADLGSTVSGVDFIGTLAATTIPASDGSYSYYAYNNGSLVRVAENAATLPAFRGYFRVAGASARSLNISLDDETTGIGSVNSGEVIVKNEVYNLKGQRVSQPTKGLYIVNGKKVVK